MRRSLCWFAIVVGSIGAALTLRADRSSGQRASRLERQTVNGREVVAREVLVKFRDGARPNAPDNRGGRRRPDDRASGPPWRISPAIAIPERRRAPPAAETPPRRRLRRAELHRARDRGAQRSALRSVVGPPQHRPGDQRPARHCREPTFTRRPPGISRSARPPTSSPSSIPASTTRIRIWRPTSGRRRRPTPSPSTAPRSRVQRALTGSMPSPVRAIRWTTTITGLTSLGTIGAAGQQRPWRRRRQLDRRS